MQLSCRNLTKVFGTGRAAQAALSDVSIDFDRGETCALVGPSGSGKTTLLALLGCLLSPTSGTVSIDGRPINFRNKGELIQHRRRSIGFVFQHANLLQFLSIEDNLRLVGHNSGVGGRELRLRTDMLLEQLGISDLRHKRPDVASGGERQRAAIARALLHRPPIILADEPTAALDWTNGHRVVQMLVEQARRERALLITVTHDSRLLPMFDRTIHIDSGRLEKS